MTSKPWLLWAHDPCPEGGWHTRGEFDTKEEAIAGARVLHAEEEKRYQDMVEFCKNDTTPWTRSNGCYDGCIVTPNAVFRLDMPKVDTPTKETTGEVEA